MNNIGLLLLAGLVVTGCGQDTLTGIADEEAGLSTAGLVATAKTDVKFVPLKGYLSGHSWYDPSRTDCPLGLLPLAGEGLGEATHVGEFAMTAEYCVDPATGAYSGTVTIVASSGDEVYTEFNGLSTSPTEYVQTETIVGGTDRFENATGSIVAHGTRGPDSFTSTFEGEVSSVGSSEL